MKIKVVPNGMQIILLREASRILKNVLIDYKHLSDQQKGEMVSINTMVNDMMEIIFEDAKYVYVNNISWVPATDEEKNRFFDYVARRKLARKINREFDALDPHSL